MQTDEEALQIPAKKISSFVRKFLPEQSWKKITVSTLPFGTSNESYSVQDLESNVKVIVELNTQRSDCKVANDLEQDRNNNDDKEADYFMSSTMNTPTEDAIVSYILSTKGWGPKVLGVNTDGKIFEDYDGEILTPETASDANVIKEIAVAFARFHSLTTEVPLAKDKMATLHSFLLEESTQPHNFTKVSRILKETLTDLDDNVIAELGKFDLEKEVKWLQQTFREIPVKQAFIRFKNSFEHVLIQNRICSTPKTPISPLTPGGSANKPISKKAVLFTDNSHAMFGPRGIDIGGHFINRMINWADRETKINEEVYPPVDERGLFAREYLQEWQQLQSDSFNVDGMDNEGQVMMEADLGALFYALYYFTWIISQESSWEDDPSIVTLLPFFHEFYARYKLFCKKKYTHWP